MKSNSILIIVQSLEQPRVIKRVIDLSYKYDFIYLVGFSRSFYLVNNSDRFSGFLNINILFQKHIVNTNLRSRVFNYTHLILFLFFRSPEVVKCYCFGLDSRLLAFLSLKRNTIYEISDISWLYFSGITRFIFANLDRFLVRLSSSVIFTSQGFYTQYYSFLPEGKVKIIENRFRPFGLVEGLDNLPNDRVRVAYVGAFRYPNIIDLLLEYFKDRSEVDIRFYGDGFSDVVSKIKNYSEKYPNIYFFGAFKNPDDLEKIYAENNLNFVAYDSSMDNEKVAMPNKFYESGFFNVPIVVSKDTYVAERVEEVGLGWSIDPSEQGIKDFFDSLSVDDLLEVHERIKLLDKRQFSED